MLKHMMVWVLMLFTMTGCAMLQNNETLVRASVEYGTLKVIDSDAERAERVVELMDDLLFLVEGDAEATIDRLDAHIRSEIDWNQLDPADTVLVNAVLNEVRGRLEDRVDEGLLDPEDRVLVSTVLTWIRDIGAQYGQSDHQ